MDFVKLKKFHSTLTAETFGNLLQQNGIEYQIKSAEALIGQADSPLGATLWVPAERLQTAHDLIDGFITAGEVTAEEAADHNDDQKNFSD